MKHLPYIVGDLVECLDDCENVVPKGTKGIVLSVDSGCLNAEWLDVELKYTKSPAQTRNRHYMYDEEIKLVKRIPHDG